MTKWGLAPHHRPSALEQRVSVETRAMGLDFTNPVGLAAGYDKDGEVIDQMLRMGFGFVEIGTVTPRPQPGNPKPRMFRLAADHGIINRYGFNSKGADYVERNLREFRELGASRSDSGGGDGEEGGESGGGAAVLSALRWAWRTLYPNPPATGLVGVNIGKNKDTEDAAVDYVSGIRQLGPHADFMVINVSSPNTAGLRDLQKANSLRELLARCIEARNALDTTTSTQVGRGRVPLLVKLAPDLTDDELKEVGATCLDVGIDGIVVSNTTNQRPEDLLAPRELRMEAGGLSGAPIRDKSTECIRKVYDATDGRIPIIGVGGIGSGRDAFEKFKAGASLVE